MALSKNIQFSSEQARQQLGVVESESASHKEMDRHAAWAVLTSFGLGDLHA